MVEKQNLTIKALKSDHIASCLPELQQNPYLETLRDNLTILREIRTNRYNYGHGN